MPARPGTKERSRGMKIKLAALVLVRMGGRTVEIPDVKVICSLHDFIYSLLFGFPIYNKARSVTVCQMETKPPPI